MSLLRPITENIVRAKMADGVDITSLDNGPDDGFLSNPLIGLLLPSLGCAGRSLLLYFHTKILKLTVNTLETVTREK